MGAHHRQSLFVYYSWILDQLRHTEPGDLLPSLGHSGLQAGLVVCRNSGSNAAGLYTRRYRLFFGAFLAQAPNLRYDRTANPRADRTSWLFYAGDRHGHRSNLDLNQRFREWTILKNPEGPYRERITLMAKSKDRWGFPYLDFKLNLKCLIGNWICVSCPNVRLVDELGESHTPGEH